MASRRGHHDVSAQWLWTLALFVFALVVVLAEDSTNPRVEAPVGSLVGRVVKFDGAQVDRFMGVPYGKAPEGSLRFQMPVPYGNVSNSGGELDAAASVSCAQLSLNPQMKPILNEDCLHLNIFRPTGTKKGDKKQVIVIVHGGAFSFGSASEPWYSGVPLARYGDVVVVGINYRLGIFGFADMKEHAPGNLGLYDQRLAFEWIQDNIDAFGGDSSRVTLMGVSAGSMSVSAHIMTPLNKAGDRQLFHGAIMDAGVMGPGIGVSSDDSIKRVRAIAKTVGCPVDEDEGSKMVECLQKADTEQLLRSAFDPDGHSPIWSFQPTFDGKFLARELAEDIRDHSDRFVKVKTLIGYAKDEGTMFATATMFTPFPNLTSESEFVDHCKKLAFGLKYPMDFDNGNVRSLVANNYYNKTSSRFLDAAAFVGDGTFYCPTNAFVHNYATVNDKGVYVYLFERKHHTKLLGMFDPAILGAHHAIPFWSFSGNMLMNFTGFELDSVNADDKAFVKDAIETVVEFARSVDQDKESSKKPAFRGVTWPDFSKGEGLLVWDEKSTVRKELVDEKRCQIVMPFFAPSKDHDTTVTNFK